MSVHLSAAAAAAATPSPSTAPSAPCPVLASHHVSPSTKGSSKASKAAKVGEQQFAKMYFNDPNSLIQEAVSRVISADKIAEEHRPFSERVRETSWVSIDAQQITAEDWQTVITTELKKPEIEQDVQKELLKHLASAREQCTSDHSCKIPMEELSQSVFQFIFNVMDSLVSGIRLHDPEHLEITEKWEEFFQMLCRIRYERDFQILDKLLEFLAYLEKQSKLLQLDWSPFPLIDKLKRFLDEPHQLEVSMAYFFANTIGTEYVMDSPFARVYRKQCLSNTEASLLACSETLYFTSLPPDLLETMYDKTLQRFIRQSQLAYHMIERLMAPFESMPQDSKFIFSKALLKTLRNQGAVLGDFARMQRPPEWSWKFERHVRLLILRFRKLSQAGEDLFDVSSFADLQDNINTFLLIRVAIEKDLCEKIVSPDAINLSGYFDKRYGGFLLCSTEVSKSLGVKSIAFIDTWIEFLKARQTCHILLNGCSLALSSLNYVMISLRIWQAAQPIVSRPKISPKNNVPEDTRSIEELLASFRSSSAQGKLPKKPAAKASAKQRGKGVASSTLSKASEIRKPTASPAPPIWVPSSPAENIVPKNAAPSAAEKGKLPKKLAGNVGLTNTASPSMKPISDSIMRFSGGLKALVAKGNKNPFLRHAVSAFDSVLFMTQACQHFPQHAGFLAKESYLSTHAFLEQWLNFHVQTDSHNLYRIAASLPQRPANVDLIGRFAEAYSWVTYDPATSIVAPLHKEIRELSLGNISQTTLGHVGNLLNELVSFATQSTFLTVPPAAELPAKSHIFSMNYTTLAMNDFEAVIDRCPLPHNHFAIQELHLAKNSHQHLLRGFAFLRENQPLEVHLSTLKSLLFWQSKGIEHLLLFLAGWDTGLHPHNHSLRSLLDQCTLDDALKTQISSKIGADLLHMHWHARYPFSNDKIQDSGHKFILQIELARELQDFSLMGTSTPLNFIPVESLTTQKIVDRFTDMTGRYSQVMQLLQDTIQKKYGA